MLKLSLASKLIEPKLTKISILLIQIRLLVHMFRETDILVELDFENDKKGRIRAKIMMTIMLTMFLFIGCKLLAYCFSMFHYILINTITVIVGTFGIIQRVYGNRWEDKIPGMI